MELYHIIGHAKGGGDYHFAFEAAYHADAMIAARKAMLAKGFAYGTFTIQFVTDAEYAALVAA